jgi:hypothetical protein
LLLHTLSVESTPVPLEFGLHSALIKLQHARDSKYNNDLYKISLSSLVKGPWASFLAVGEDSALLR